MLSGNDEVDDFDSWLHPCLICRIPTQILPAQEASLDLPARTCLGTYLGPQLRERGWVVAPLIQLQGWVKFFVGINVADLVTNYQRARLREGGQRLRGLHLVIPAPLVQHRRNGKDIDLPYKCLQFWVLQRQNVRLDKMGAEAILISVQLILHIPMADNVDTIQVVGRCTVEGETAHVGPKEAAHVQECVALAQSL